MRVLVIGASGLVGSHVFREAGVRGMVVAGTYRNQEHPGLQRLDLDDGEGLQRLLGEFGPDWVVHAAGWTWVDGCERDRERAFRENAAQPEAIARLCRGAGIRFCQVSTSYVFDGREGNYSEGAAPCPINVYGQSKLEGERRVRELCGETSLIPRLICVWGEEARRKNFVYQVAAAVREGRCLRLPSDQAGNPSWAGDLAAWMLDLMQAREAGVWHLGGGGAELTRVQWTEAILAGLSRKGPGWERRVRDWRHEALPTEALGQEAPRPLRAGMDTRAIQARFPRTPLGPAELGVISLEELA